MEIDVFHEKMQILICTWKDGERASKQPREVWNVFYQLLDLAQIPHEFDRLIPYAVMLKKWNQLTSEATKKRINPAPAHPNEKRWPILVFHPWSLHRFRP